MGVQTYEKYYGATIMLSKGDSIHQVRSMWGIDNASLQGIRDAVKEINKSHAAEKYGGIAGSVLSTPEVLISCSPPVIGTRKEV